MKLKNSLFFLFGALLIALDQAAKRLAYAKGAGSFLARYLQKLRPAFGFKIFPNYNFAFSLHVPIVLTYIIYAVLLGLLLFWFSDVENRTWKIKFGVTLILAGALSNIFDRVYLGYVRDFIFVFWGNIFNLADMYIVLGILLLVF